jgi:hypothetical protein
LIEEGRRFAMRPLLIALLFLLAGCAEPVDNQEAEIMPVQDSESDSRSENSAALSQVIATPWMEMFLEP